MIRTGLSGVLSGRTGSLKNTFRENMNLRQLLFRIVLTGGCLPRRFTRGGRARGARTAPYGHGPTFLERLFRHAPPTALIIDETTRFFAAATFLARRRIFYLLAPDSGFHTRLKPKPRKSFRLSVAKSVTPNAIKLSAVRVS